MENLHNTVARYSAEKQIALDALAVLKEYKKEINNSNKVLKEKMEERDVYMCLDSMGLSSLNFSRHNRELRERLQVTVYGSGFPRVVPTKAKCIENLTKYAVDMQRNIDKLNREIDGFTETRKEFTELFTKMSALRDTLSGTAWKALIDGAGINTILR